MSSSGGEVSAPVVEQPPLIPKSELEDWGIKTTFGVLAGVLYGGCKEAMVFSEKERMLLDQHSAESDPRKRRNLLRLIQEEKVLRVARGTAIGGAKLGLFSALFCGTEKYLAHVRSSHDTFNVVASGALTAGTIGFLLPGSFSWRLRSAFLGSVLGAAFGVPLGYLQTTINTKLEYLKLEDTPVEHKSEDSVVQHDAVGDAIRRLEERVSRK